MGGILTLAASRCGRSPVLLWRARSWWLCWQPWATALVGRRCSENRAAFSLIRARDNWLVRLASVFGCSVCTRQEDIGTTRGTFKRFTLELHPVVFVLFSVFHGGGQRQNITDGFDGLAAGTTAAAALACCAGMAARQP